MAAMGDGAKAWAMVVTGIVAAIVGVVFTLQGSGHLSGSAMTGVRLWAVIGPIVAVAGLWLAVRGIRRQRSSPRRR